LGDGARASTCLEIGTVAVPPESCGAPPVLPGIAVVETPQ